MTRLSIVIPTIARGPWVRIAIDSVVKQLPDDDSCELLIIDNRVAPGGQPDLFEMCAAIDPRIQVILEPSPGLTAARHAGLMSARGDLFALLDDDVVVPAGWLASVLDTFRDDACELAGGPCLPLIEGQAPSWLTTFIEPTRYGGWACGSLSLLDLGTYEGDIDPNLIWGLNFVTRKQTVLLHGGFHPDTFPPELQRWQGDGETGLTRKYADAGILARYRRELLVFHQCPQERMTFDYFARRAYFQGVCDSFTHIRLNPRSIKPTWIRRLRNAGRKWSANHGRLLRRFAHRLSLRSAPPGVATRRILGLALRFEHARGWYFHFDEVRLDPELLRWVTADSFVSLKVPVGGPPPSENSGRAARA